MSKSIKSDGTVNAAILAMCKREGALTAYTRERVDEALTAENLKACDYSTLALLAHCYREAFGAIHCPTQHQLETKAAQSSVYRAYLGGTSGKRRAAVLLASDEDPFRVLDEVKAEMAARREAEAGHRPEREPVEQQ